MSDTYKTRGNDLRLQKSRLKYDMCKFYFTDRVVDQWNGLPNWVVTANNTKIFKNDLISTGNIRILSEWLPYHQDGTITLLSPVPSRGQHSRQCYSNVKVPS